MNNSPTTATATTASTDTPAIDYGLFTADQLIKTLFDQCKDNAPLPLLEWLSDADGMTAHDLNQLGDMCDAIGGAIACDGIGFNRIDTVFVSLAESIKTASACLAVAAQARKICASVGGAV